MTAQVLFNQFAYVDRLKAGGFTDGQARASADALERYPSVLNRIGIPESGNF